MATGGAFERDGFAVSGGAFSRDCLGSRGLALSGGAEARGTVSSTIDEGEAAGLELVGADVEAAAEVSPRGGGKPGGEAFERDGLGAGGGIGGGVDASG